MSNALPDDIEIVQVVMHKVVFDKVADYLKAIEFTTYIIPDCEEGIVTYGVAPSEKRWRASE